jgi:hypothetical protein
MDFETAIQAHSSWKIKLRNYLNNPDGSIDLLQLEKDNVCPLGCWLHSVESSRFNKMPEFHQLITAHAIFHKEAANIVRRKNKGEAIDADIALNSNSSFAKASREVVSILMNLKRM